MKLSIETQCMRLNCAVHLPLENKSSNCILLFMIRLGLAWKNFSSAFFAFSLTCARVVIIIFQFADFVAIFAAALHPICMRFCLTFFPRSLRLHTSLFFILCASCTTNHFPFEKYYFIGHFFAVAASAVFAALQSHIIIFCTVQLHITIFPIFYLFYASACQSNKKRLSQSKVKERRNRENAFTLQRGKEQSGKFCTWMNKLNKNQKCANARISLSHLLQVRNLLIQREKQREASFVMMIPVLYYHLRFMHRIMSRALL